MFTKCVELLTKIEIRQRFSGNNSLKGGQKEYLDIESLKYLKLLRNSINMQF